MKKILSHLIPIFALSMFVNLASADPSPGEDEAIQHLLSYVRGSSLTFIRNGEESNCERAADHLRRKYESMKKQISTADEFIEKAASKSLLSGKPYQVKLSDGEVKPASNFLKEELARYRNQGK